MNSLNLNKVFFFIVILANTEYDTTNSAAVLHSIHKRLNCRLDVSDEKRDERNFFIVRDEK